MMRPIRCFSCGKVLPWKKYDATFQEKEEDHSKSVAQKLSMDECGLRRMCCRRMVLGDPVKLRERSALYSDTVRTESPVVDLEN